MQTQINFLCAIKPSVQTDRLIEHIDITIINYSREWKAYIFLLTLMTLYFDEVKPF